MEKDTIIICNQRVDDIGLGLLAGGLLGAVAGALTLVLGRNGYVATNPYSKEYVRRVDDLLSRAVVD